MDIYVSLSFDAAHRLPAVPAGTNAATCTAIPFAVEVYVQGDVAENTGWVADFGDIKTIAKSYVDQLDHTYLNDIAGLENPTSENIAVWLWRLSRSSRGFPNRGQGKPHLWRGVHGQVEEA